MVIDLIHRHLGGGRVDKERPRALQRKLSYLKDYITLIGLDSEAAKPYRTLLTQIKIQSEFRHDIVHGFITDMAEETGQAQMIRFLHAGDRLNRKHVTVNIDILIKAAREADALAGQTLTLTSKLCDEILALYELAEQQTRR